MPQVRARERPAGIAATFRIRGAGIASVPGRLDLQAAMHDPEHGVLALRVLAQPGLLAADGPAGGPAERLLVIGARALRGRALVERHQDVAAELELDLRGALGRQLLPAAVEVAAEDCARLADPPLLRERVDRDSAGVGEEASLPGHESVQAA